MFACSGRVPQAFESQLTWSHPPFRSASSRAFRRVIRSRLEASLIGPALSTRRSIRASTSSSGYASRASSTRSRTFSHAKTDGGMDVVPFSSCSAVRVKLISRRIFASATIRGSSVGVGDGVGGGGGVGDGGGVGRGVGVGGGVGLIDAVCISNAPMSLRPFFTRSNPGLR
jgi:hypothetical protein